MSKPWTATRDRLFLYFAGAFWVFALQWATVGVLHLPVETRHYLYLPRLGAFLLIIVGIVDKNRRAR
ncbi:MAG: DUF5985 family protein [Acidobacteriota bacterium]